MCLAWPVASISSTSERDLERFVTHQDIVFEGDHDEDR